MFVKVKYEFFLFEHTHLEKGKKMQIYLHLM
jgi:hypothetical protein